jgi:hypothetical protein
MDVFMARYLVKHREIFIFTFKGDVPVPNQVPCHEDEPCD